MDFQYLTEQFIKSGVYLRAWSPKTVRTYRQGLNAFQMAIGEPCSTVQPSATGSDGLLTKAHLDTFVIWMRQRGLTAGGCNMYIRTVNSFLSWLHDEGTIQTKLKIRLLPNKTKPLQGFSQQEIYSLLSFRPKGFTELRTWTLTITLLDTGCRIDELLTLQVTNLNLDDLQFTVIGKGNKERKVPFSLELRKFLFRYIQAISKRVPRFTIVFCTGNGGHLSYRNTYRGIKNLCAKAGVIGPHVHPHAFRHHFAVTYIRRGGDIYRLSRILGHTSISTTQIYLRSMGIEAIGENHSELSPLCHQG